MGSQISTISLTFFEIINEMFIAVSSSVFGISVLIHHGVTNRHLFKTLVVCSIATSCILYVYQGSDVAKPSKRKVILITGCDSGLGFSLAQHACEIGFTVFAGFLSLESQGAKKLKLLGDKIHEVELDITQNGSIREAVNIVEDFLKNNPKYAFWSLINNAGVMVFGEFEWQTERLIKQQIDVNLHGTIKVTKAFCPLLRAYKGRIITVTSHCAEASLPGIAVYGATKAGLAGWSDALRVELEKYGVKVIMFVPGSLTRETNIMAKQVDYVYEMHSAFSIEQLDFYDDYFKRYNSYLGLLPRPRDVLKIDDEKLYLLYQRALLEMNPSARYIHEPLRYSIYHKLFKLVPYKLRDLLILRFMQMPEYLPRKKIPPPPDEIA